MSKRETIPQITGAEKVKSANGSKRKMGRIVAFLTREEIDFIDKLAKDALFSTGHKLSRTDIVGAFVDAVKSKEINAEGVHSKTELEQKLLSAMKINLPQAIYNLKKERDNPC